MQPPTHIVSLGRIGFLAYRGMKKIQAGFDANPGGYAFDVVDEKTAVDTSLKVELALFLPLPLSVTPVSSILPAKHDMRQPIDRSSCCC
jgi:hypothetical protein